MRVCAPLGTAPDRSSPHSPANQRACQRLRIASHALGAGLEVRGSMKCVRAGRRRPRRLGLRGICHGLGFGYRVRRRFARRVCGICHGGIERRRLGCGISRTGQLELGLLSGLLGLGCGISRTPATPAGASSNGAGSGSTGPSGPARSRSSGAGSGGADAPARCRFHARRGP